MKWNLYGNGEGDKLWAALAAISLIILVFVFIKFGDTEKVIKADEYAGNFYKPATYTNAAQASNLLYQSMSGSYELGCPQLEMKQTSKGIIYIAQIPTKYPKHCFFAAYSEVSRMGTTREITLTEHNTYAGKYDDTRKNIYDIYNNSDANGKLECEKEMTTDDGYYLLDYVFDVSPASFTESLYPVTLKSLFPGVDWDGGDCIELIAPFNFTFVNNNTDGDTGVGESIVIMDMSKQTRITFEHAVNWYCAGPVGIGQSVGQVLGESGEIEYVYSGWHEHGKASGSNSSDLAHYSIIGSSKNAEVTGGSYGSVIGYADSNTTIKVEILEDGSWKVISLYDWILSHD